MKNLPQDLKMNITEMERKVANDNELAEHIGDIIVRVLHLKPNQGNKFLYSTDFGLKTKKGIARVIFSAISAE